MLDDRTGADERTLYVWGDTGSDDACAELKNPRTIVSTEGLRRLRIYCGARSHSVPDAIAAHVAGIVLGTPPKDEAYPGQHALQWFIQQANRVDLAFVNVQLGIVSGESPSEAIKQDWRNAMQSKALAEHVEKGEWRDAWDTIKDNFKGSADEAGVTIQDPPWYSKQVSLGAIRAVGHGPKNVREALAAIGRLPRALPVQNARSSYSPVAADLPPDTLALLDYYAHHSPGDLITAGQWALLRKASS